MTSQGSGAGFVLFVKDLAGTAAFYGAVLQLEVAEEGETFQVLAGPGLELVIHQIPAGIAAAMHIESPPVLRDDTPLKPVFTVTDLARVRESATAAGGGLEDEASAWTWRGHRILDGWDPEGNIIQFRAAAVIREDTMTHRPDPDRAMVHARRMPAGAEAVFAAFRDPARLARWWGPEGFHNRILEFDFREGGTWRLEMTGPDGTVYPNLWTLLAIEPDRRLLLDHVDESHHFLLEIRLEPEGSGTVVHWVQTFDTAAVKESLAGFVGPANEQNLARWQAVVLESAGSR